MEERKESTARHVRSFEDLHLASANVYACIDVYDLFRRVVNMISSLEYSYMYLVVLRSVITDSPQKKLLCNKWHKLERSVIQVPFKTTVDVLTDATNVPQLTRDIHRYAASGKSRGSGHADVDDVVATQEDLVVGLHRLPVDDLAGVLQHDVHVPIDGGENARVDEVVM